MRLFTKSAGTIEQKGVAQLLQIEEVRLKSSRRCGFSNHHIIDNRVYSIIYDHMHKKLVFF